MVAGRVAQPEPDLVPDLGLGPVRRRLSRARNMPCQSGISHNSSAPLTARCVPSRSVSFRLVKSRLAARLFVLFFIYLLFLCELLIYWNTSSDTYILYQGKSRRTSVNANRNGLKTQPSEVEILIARHPIETEIEIGEERRRRNQRDYCINFAKLLQNLNACVP